MSKNETEIRIRTIAPNLKKELDRIAARAGVTTSAFVKYNLRILVDGYLKNEKGPK